MRAKVPESNKSKQVPLSLYPTQRKFARRRAAQVNLSFSAYIQRLIELDAARNILPEALTHKMEAA